MNINKLIITTTTVEQLNKKYKTNITICPTKIKNANKRKMFSGQTEVLSKTTRDAVKTAINTLSRGGEDLVYTAILLCGFDNGYPKDEKMVARIFSNKYDIPALVNDGITKLQGVVLEPQIQLFSTSIPSFEEDSLDDFA